MKQREVAERLGVSVGRVGSWESGSTSPDEGSVYKLCHEHNVRREWLKRGEGEMFQPKPDASKLREFDDEDVYYEAMDRLYNSLPAAAKEAFERFCRELRE